MTFTFSGTVTDADGDSDSTMKSIVVAASPPADTTAPETTIDSGPTGTTNDSTPTFGFSSSEGASTFQCRVDSGFWAGCSSPWTTSARSLTSGTKYWIALMGTGGTLKCRDGAGSSGCHSESSSSHSLKTLPATWQTGASWTSCPLSGYASS